MSTKAGWKPIPHSQSWFCIYQSLPILAKLQSREHLRRKVQECLFQWSLHKNFLWKLLNLFSNHHLKTLLGIVHCKTANWSLDKERIIWRVKSIGYVTNDYLMTLHLCFCITLYLSASFDIVDQFYYIYWNILMILKDMYGMHCSSLK